MPFALKTIKKYFTDPKQMIQRSKWTN